MLEELARCSELLSLKKLVPPDSCAADWMSGESRNIPDEMRRVKSSGGGGSLTVGCGCADDEVAVRSHSWSIVWSHGGGQRQKPVGALKASSDESE